MIRASHIMFWFGMSIVASLALYHTSDRTRQLEHQLRSINTSIEAEQQKIHVLKAEWVFLANPARVQTIANKFLTLRPTEPRQVLSMNDIEETIPTRKESMESVAVAATPIATIESSLPVPTPLAKPSAPPRVAVAAHVPRKSSTLVHKISVTASKAPTHINERMVIQHAANAQTNDKIGTLIAELGTNQ